MILYFSATGNSKYVAMRMADALNTQVYNIEDCMEKQQYCFECEEPIGIVSPVYFWGIPKNVWEFLSRLSSVKTPYFFYVATYGTTPGGAGKMAERAMTAIHKKFDAMFSVRMPDTWTPVFNLSDQAAVKQKNDIAEKQLNEVITKLQARPCGNYIDRQVPMLAARAFYSTYDSCRKTSHFTVDDICIGCGLCEKNCPAKAISMKDGRPEWVKKDCIMCLGCLHRCPKFAIQYGEKTRKHGQYLNPYVSR